MELVLSFFLVVTPTIEYQFFPGFQTLPRPKLELTIEPIPPAHSIVGKFDPVVSV